MRNNSSLFLFIHFILTLSLCGRNHTELLLCVDMYKHTHMNTHICVFFPQNVGHDLKGSYYYDMDSYGCVV